MKKGRPKNEKPVNSMRDPILEVVRIWAAATPADGTPVEAYFVAIGCKPPLPPTIRYRPPGRYRLPMAVCAIQAPDRRIVGVQVIILDREEPRLADLPRPRIVVGTLGDGAVRLAAAGPGLKLANTVEDALLLMQATGNPTWASLTPWRQDGVELLRLAA